MPAFKYFIYPLLICCLLSSVSFAEEVENYDWFFEDFEAKIDLVNEGELVFLAQRPEKKTHRHMNQITITAASLDTGWSSLKQCHENLDILDAVQITYNKDTTRNHHILSYTNIDRVWINQTNVELEGIQDNAKVCLTLETKSVHSASNGTYVVRNGPFMRQFLDGFYPLHVELDIKYPCDLLRFVKTKNTPQPGFSVTENDCHITVDAWFEGRLYTELLFERSVKSTR